MPCNSDYLEANDYERELSRVACLLDELDGKPIDQSHWRGSAGPYHPAVYSRCITKEDADRMYSLEMQMWWRDHQAADKARQKLGSFARGGCGGDDWKEEGMKTVWNGWNLVKVWAFVLTASMIPAGIVYLLGIQDPTIGVLIGAPFGVCSMLLGISWWPCWDFEWREKTPAHLAERAGFEPS